MKIRELKGIVNALDDNVDVVIRNHHLEDVVVQKAKVALDHSDKKNPQIALFLHEKTL